MDTTIKVTVYAKSLQGRLADLKAAREKALEAHRNDLTKWRKSLVDWIAKNAKSRIGAITVDELKRTRYGANCTPFDTSSFFRGCPDAPTYPDDKQIREITALLRQLGITGQDTVKVSTSDVERYLGDGGKIDN